MQERIHDHGGEAILFDAAVSPQVERDWFDPQSWAARGGLRVQKGGRGSVAFIDTPVGECVLRHYRRGGLVARLMGDRYLWIGADHTRSFAEFRLLGLIASLGLPGPQAMACRYRRVGPFYTADLITRRVDDALTLAEHLAAGTLDAALAARTGELVARFHKAGIWHADLNAHNVLVTPRGLVLIDFDRGEQRPVSRSWQQANLRRLHRSLLKLARPGHEVDAFERQLWQPLLQGYDEAMRA